MVPRRQGQRRHFEAVVNLFFVLRRILVSGPIAALAAASPRRKACGGAGLYA